MIQCALPILAILAGSIPLLWGTASARADSRPWRSSSAPVLLTLSDYVVQPPGDEGEPDPEDTNPGNTKLLEPPESKEGAQQQPPPQQGTNQPVWGASVPDTGRTDSMAWFQEDKTIGLDSLPEETAPAIATQAAGAPVVKHRRGVVGLHPLALLAGLIAVHIFVISAAGK